jgi:hypothetical protein
MAYLTVKILWNFKQHNGSQQLFAAFGPILGVAVWERWFAII